MEAAVLDLYTGDHLIVAPLLLLYIGENIKPGEHCSTVFLGGVKWLGTAMLLMLVEATWCRNAVPV